MDKYKLEQIVESLFLIPPLFKKKLVKHDLYGDDMDLSPSHFHVLFILEEMGSLSVSELASTLTISKSNTTPLIQRLIDKKFIERVTDEKDRRYININLTDEGRNFIKDHKALVMNDLRSKLTDFDDEDLEQLLVSLQTLKDIILRIK